MAPDFSVAANHPLATRAGLEILERGGNVYDAALAVSASLGVVQPHLNGLGGDLFAVVDDGGVRSVNGSGYAAELATADFFSSRGLSSIPKRGPLSSFVVPGMVSAWKLLSEQCTMDMPDLFRRAIQYATEGFRVQNSLFNSISLTKSDDSDWGKIYHDISKGGTIYQKELGNTLDLVSRDEGHSFYHGALAKSIEADMLAKGGLIRFSDMDGYEAKWVDPISTTYRGRTVYTTPPNSQGATLLFWMNMLSRHSLSSMEKNDYYGTLLSAMNIAYHYRSRFIGDPEYVILPPHLLSPEYHYVAEDASRARADSLSDTTAFSVYDGNAGISAIQSNYMGFGSGHTIQGTGINMNNRGSYFALDSSHHNHVAPHKKTFHTLMATVCKGPENLYLSSMGGDVQPQTNIQIISRILDRGEDIQHAIAAPRFCYPASIYSSSTLYAEKSLGLKLAEPVDDNNSMMGHAQGILVSDTVTPGFDPRGDAFEKY